MMKFKVKRHHVGDKPYFPGDQREADKRDVQHLIDNHVLVEILPEKMQASSDNKAEPTVKNKAQGQKD